MSRRSTAFRATALATLLLVAASCATTQLPPISASGAGFEPLPDELELWEQARAEERQLLAEAVLYDDPLLEDYLGEVVARLTPPGMAANPAVSYRVRILQDPTLNAFAYPHGSLYVHTGLLARMDNEAQLATVLAHEMTHVEERHMLRYQRSAHNKQIGLTVAAVTAAVILAGEQGDAYGEGNWRKGATIGVLSDLLLGLGLQLAFLASVNGYGRDLELAADYGGFAKLAAVGYDAGEAPEVYAALLEERGDSSKLEGFFFGSHPRLTERIASARLWLGEHPAADRPGPAATPAGDEDFARRIRPVVRDDAGLNIELGRLALAEAELGQALGWMPEDPQTHFLLARLRLAQAEAEPSPGARDAYFDDAEVALREAIRLDPDRPPAHRELGVLLHRRDRPEGACIAFRHYLELAPEAEDAQRIRDYLLELQGHC